MWLTPKRAGWFPPRSLRSTDYERVALAVLGDDIRAPRLFLRWSRELDSARLVEFVCLLNIVRREGKSRELADAILVLVGCKKDNARLGLWNPQLNPALLVVKRLVRHNGESKFFRVEVECTILVPHRDAREF